MENEAGRRLVHSSSRNFSRPFPSPLTTNSLNSPMKESSLHNVFSRLPRSASLFNLSKQPSASDNMATNKLPDFTGATSRSNIYATSNAHDVTISSTIKASSHTVAGPGTSSTCSPDKPITNMTPEIWSTLERHREKLWMDLFRPVSSVDMTSFKPDQNGSKEQLLKPTSTETLPISPYDELCPLLQFRQLHHLKLTSMLESYQPIIWAVCWLQPFLKTVHLEMALPPIFNTNTDHPYRPIDAIWCLNNAYGSDLNLSEYLGHHGDGTLHEEFGEGEYLDSQAIKMAQQDIATDLPFNNLRYLPIEKLTLMNFVVDGGAIMRWFDPKRFKELEFREGCIDAGSYLFEGMEHVKITRPRPLPLHRSAVLVIPGELKIVELKKGKVVSRKDAVTGKEELPSAQKQPGLKAKVSQLMHGFGAKNKENKQVPVQ